MSSYLRAVMGGVLGALVGLAIYKFVGCKTGACPLSGNLWVSMILWGLLGAVTAAR